ncbi:hypothetical protein MMC10_009378, partial [Thelotrema lepadinum]|nr:hypothetical protein [Thelotrema lepadinum]
MTTGKTPAEDYFLALSVRSDVEVPHERSRLLGSIPLMKIAVPSVWRKAPADGRIVGATVDFYLLRELAGPPSLISFT